jgi:hypothetical protein
MKHLIVLIIALLIPAAAMAKGSCKEDKQKFCKDATHVVPCLDQHKAELGEACKAHLKAKANAKKAKRGKEEGADVLAPRGVYGPMGHRLTRAPQPLTKEDCKTAGMTWIDQSNVCG